MSPRRRSLQRAAVAALAGIASLWAPAAGADVLLFSSSARLEQGFTAPVFVDLNGTAAGGTTLTFATTQARQRVVILFYVTCLVVTDQPDKAGFVTAEIRINPAGPAGEFVVPPTNNGGSTLCSGPTNFEQFGAYEVGVTVVASAVLSEAGTHALRVRAIPEMCCGQPGTARATLGDLSLTVMR
jgi:hypothetical protein